MELNSKMKNLYGLILAGGSGIRLWPISRDYYPKQFLKLIGNQTLIQQTFSRLKKIIPSQNIYITTNRIFVDEIISQLKHLGLKNENIIIQPTDKNTAPAIAQGSKKIFDKDNSAIIISCPSDHLIRPEKEFVFSVEAGYKLAKKNLLVTFGIKPDQPTSELGYIVPEKTNRINLNSYKSFKVTRFIEKPAVEKAKTLISSGALWNSGIFIWKAGIILSELKKFSKETYQTLESTKNYFLTPSVSIDKSVLEKSSLVWVIPVSFNWKDIGSWKALYELLPKDSNKNVLNNRVIVFNSKDSLIYGSENRMVAAINVHDLIVVDTKDYVFISQKENAHEVKNLLKLMEENKLEKNLQRPLVSIITPTFNDQRYIESTISSLINQNYKNIEYTVVDGGSKDQTVDIVNKYIPKIEHLISMPDTGKFERINRGIEISNGEIIGILLPADSYIDKNIISDVVQNLELQKADVCWGDLVYVSSQNADKIAMYWKSANYQEDLLQTGWIPPHSTFFVKRKIYEKYGKFNTRFQIAAEYELMLRLLEKHKVKGIYIPKILVKMTGKGVNLKNIIDRIKGNLESLESWKENNLKVNPFILISKNISKIPQLLKKKDLESPLD